MSPRHLFFACVLLAAFATAGPAQAKCKAGVHKFGSTNARTFCGAAKSTVAMPTKSVSFHQGSCQRTKNYFTINIGTIVLGDTTKTRPPYFGITVGKTQLGGSPAGHDGTYNQDLYISFVTGGKSYSLTQSTITLAGNRTKGTFSGQLLGKGGAVTGTFHC